MEPGCPDGCPCPSYECPNHDDEAILVLNSGYSQNRPAILLSTSQESYHQLNFTFTEATSTFASCSVIFNNQFFIYGGSNSDTKRQISHVTNCHLQRIGSLPFDLDYGTCTTNQNYVIWCFDYDATKSCWKSTSPTSDWESVQQSNVDHRKIRISASQGELPCGEH